MIRDRLHDALSRIPVIAILRGITPNDVVGVAEILVENDIRVIEIPLNSPNPLESIHILRSMLPSEIVVGAGTVLSIDQARQVSEAGGEIALSPNTNAKVIKACLDFGILPIPGIVTPTEAMTAVHAGARFLKCFPISQAGPAEVRAIKSVLPHRTSFMGVGGVNLDTSREIVDKGFEAVGIGSALYKPGQSTDDLRLRARVVRDAFDQK